MTVTYIHYKGILAWARGCICDGITRLRVPVLFFFFFFSLHTYVYMMIYRYI